MHIGIAMEMPSFRSVVHTAEQESAVGLLFGQVSAGSLVTPAPHVGSRALCALYQTTLDLLFTASTVRFRCLVAINVTLNQRL